MKIETKNEIWDNVYYMSNNKVECSSIKEINTNTGKCCVGGVFLTKTTIEVVLDNGLRRNAEDVFKTKDELLKSL